MFSNIYFDPMRSRIHLWEMIAGKRKRTEHNIVYEYYVEDTTGQSEIKDVFGKKMVLKSTDRRRNIMDLKDAETYMCEGDLPEDVKFLQKKYGNVVAILPNMADYNIAYIDIEVGAKPEDGFPEASVAKHPINLITVKFSKSGEMYTFGTSEYTGSQVKNYFFVPDEKQMIERFLDIFRKNKADIVTGWYIDEFDIPYIFNRCERLAIDSEQLSPINIVQAKKTGEIIIAGLAVLDYLKLYKKFMQGTLESYSLHYVGMHEVKEGKIELDGAVNTIWQTDWNKFVEYNVQDVVLVEKIDKKMKYIELALTLSIESLTPPEKIFSSMAVLQGFVLKEMHKNKMVLPDSEHNDHQRFPGAYVYAKEGFYENVINFDVESLYPHCIMSWNISPETIVLPHETERIERLRAEGNLIETPVGRENGFVWTPDEEDEDNTPIVKCEFKGETAYFEHIYYDKSITAIIPTVVKKIFDERKKFKKLAKECKAKGDIAGFQLNDRLQYTRKIMANSLYGVIANPHFSLYNVKNAMAVTLGGQDIIQFLSSNIGNYLRNVGYKGYKTKKDPVILIDTDSAHLHINDVYQNTKKEGETFLEWAKIAEKEFFAPFWKKLLKVHSEQFNSFNVVNFQREKICDKYLVLAKKKYSVSCLDKEGETFDIPRIFTTGIEIVRNDTPKFCRERLKMVIQKIFDNSKDRNALIEYLKEVKKEFKESKIEDISIAKGITDYDKYGKEVGYYLQNGLSYPSGCPIHVRAAINYNYLNTKYKLGGVPIVNKSKMKMIHIVPQNEINQDIVGYIGNFPEALKSRFKIDYDRQWKRTFQDIVERFFEVLGFGEINLQAQKMNKFIEF